MKIVRYNISLVKSDKSIISFTDLTFDICLKTINTHLQSEYNMDFQIKKHNLVDYARHKPKNKILAKIINSFEKLEIKKTTVPTTVLTTNVELPMSNIPQNTILTI